MIITVVLPKSGLTMEEGKIVEWLKKEGDPVEKGASIAVMETEKMTIDVEAPASGILLKILAPVDTTAVIGETIAYIGDVGDILPEIHPNENRVLEVQSEFSSSPAKEEIASPTEVGYRATPKAKKLAREHGVELKTVRGTGSGGLVTEQDVLLHVNLNAGKEVEENIPAVREVIPLSETRKVIARRLTDSLTTMAQVSIMYETDATELVKLRQKKTDEMTPSYTAILIKVVAAALQEHPSFNAILETEQIKILRNINIGFAVSAEQGLNVPVIKDAEKKSLDEVSRRVNELVEKTRSGKLTRDDVSAGTFTISNLGMSAVDSFTPIINPPQVAILGIGRIIEKIVPVNGGSQVRPRLTLSLTFDHRVTDGFNAAEFLKEITLILESSERICRVVGGG